MSKLTPDTLRELRNDLYDWGGFEADEVEREHIDDWCITIIEHAIAWEAELARLRELVEKQQELAAAQNELLSAYRLGSDKRAGRAIDRLDKVRAEIAALDQSDAGEEKQDE